MGHGMMLYGHLGVQLYIAGRKSHCQSLYAELRECVSGLLAVPSMPVLCEC